MKELTLAATVENIQAVTDFVNEQLETVDCPLKAQMQVDIAIDELFGNIAHYAYAPSTGDATVRVEIEENPLAVTLTFTDCGTPYNPLTQADPDVTLCAEERQAGGLGIFMVKKTMDEMKYEYNDSKNILTIRKILN
ncbi:MAG: ATP-binding protein [Clostridia bacterium]|nr:ATP-binding protein [Clostridia bacterium]